MTGGKLGSRSPTTPPNALNPTAPTTPPNALNPTAPTTPPERVESNSNDGILRNIILASHQYPLEFINRNAILENGLLNPVNLHDLNYFIRQNYPRELLFWLLVDRFMLISGPVTIGWHYDPPNDYGCAREDPKQRCFREWAEIAVITGLTVEAKIIQLKFDDKITGKEYSRFCFDPVLAKEGRRAMDPARLHTLQTTYLDIDLKRFPQCDEPSWNPGARGHEWETDTLFFNLGPYTLKIPTRSTYSIYQFLGQLLRQQRDHIPPPQGVYIPRLEEAGPPTLSTEPNNPELLTIIPAQPGAQCFAHTSFLSVDYCVPEQGATNTKRIFSLLARIVDDQTPTHLVKQKRRHTLSNKFFRAKLVANNNDPLCHFKLEKHGRIQAEMRMAAYPAREINGRNRSLTCFKNAETQIR
jgi:hypothetical protein